MTAEKFEDFCVAGKELFLVQNNSHKVYTLNWEEYGLRITIPHEAVPLYDTVEVAITALVGGEFILPEDTELVSAVYAISVSKPLLKPVQLEIQHCVSIEEPAHSNYLSFATAHSDEASYEFQPVKGAGEFSIGSRYGSIYITEFSPWSIIKKIRRKIRRKIRHFLPSSSTLPRTLEPAPPSTPPQPTHQPSLSSSSSATIHPSPSPSSVASTVPSPPSPSPSAPSLGEDTDAGSMGNTTKAAANELATASTESPSSSDNSSLEGMYMHTIVQYIYIRICIDQAPFNCYYGQVVYDVKRPGREWLMSFLTSRDLNAMIKV